MITEDYVSFETAKFLKERGFDDMCHAFYDKDGIFINLLQFIGNSNFISINEEKVTFAPTLQMAMKWLREVHHLHCAIGILYKDGKIIYFPNVDSTECSPEPEEEFVQEEYHSDEYFYSYEQACEAAIKYCLENLI